MRQSDYAGKLETLLLALMNEAIGHGPDNLLQFAQAIDEYASKVRETRLDMSVHTRFHCYDCGKLWTVSMTVKREHGCQPDTCPNCFENSEHAIVYGRKSQFVTWRYCDETEIANWRKETGRDE